MPLGETTSEKMLEEGVRHSLTLAGGMISDVFMSCDKRTPKIVMTKETIRIGCAKITVEALQFILERHKEQFIKPEVVVLQ